jgi:glycosyltransferase 2 family protein
MKFGVIAAAFAGLAVTTWLVYHIGLAGVASTIMSVGWGGFALLCFCALLTFAILGAAWFALMTSLPASQMANFIWGRIVRDAAGEVLPFSQVGGILIGVRALVLRGIAIPVAAASSIVDVTTEMMAQVVFILIGIVPLAASQKSGPLPAAMIAGVVFALAGSLAFIVLQRRGLGFAQNLAERFLPEAAKRAESFRRAVDAIYENPERLALSSFIHLIGWLASAFGTWLAVRLVGGRLDFGGAVAIESILSALRSAAFVVPGALGVQEAGYAMLMPLFGLPAEIGLAVSLLKRAREVVLGVPVLLIWQGIEGHRALRAPLLEP